MAVLGTRPVSTQFSSILQLVSSSGPSIHRLTDFESMEDVYDLARLAATSSDSISDTGHSFSSQNSASSTNHSFHSPLLRSTSFQNDAKFSSDLGTPPIPNYLPKHKRPGRSSLTCCADHNHPKIDQQSIPFQNLPTHSKSFNVNVLRHSEPRAGSGKQNQDQLPAVDEPLSGSSTAPTAPLSPSNDSRSASDSPPTTPRTPSFLYNISRHSAREADSHARRKSLDLGPGKVQAGIRRLKRSPSARTMRTGDRPATSGVESRDYDIQNLHAEPQLTEQQKLVVVKRARKIAQVFGSEAPTELIQGPDYHCRLSTDRRDSLCTILSTEAPPSIQSTRRRSNSASSTSITETRRRPSSIKTSLDQAESSSRPPPDLIPNEPVEVPAPPSPTSTSANFRERRRRAAKLAQFFGVNYQDISQSVSQTFVVPSTPKQDAATVVPPMVEVDVKVAGRRFWGLADGEMRNAEVAEVIDKLRGLKAA